MDYTIVDVISGEELGVIEEPNDLDDADILEELEANDYIGDSYSSRITRIADTLLIFEDAVHTLTLKPIPESEDDEDDEDDPDMDD